MAGEASQKDMETISNGIIDGLGTTDQLPGNVRAQLFQYWGRMGIDMTQPDSAITQAQLEELKKQREAQQGGILNSPIFKPIEWIGSKIYQVYSATISPAVSSVAMAAHSAIYGRPNYIGEEGEWDAFKDYWHYSHNVSPGQSIWMLGLNNKELKDRGISPDQIAHDTALQKKGQYRDTPTVNDPFGIKTRSQEYFGQGAAKYVTGATDFAVSWYADPLVVAGKTLGALKGAKYTRPIAPAIAREERAVKGVNASLSEEQVNRLAWENFSQKSQFESLTDHIMSVKAANPDTAAAVLTRSVPTLSKSANGPAAARLLAQATDKTEVANVLRVTMGDPGAREALKFQNSELAFQVDELNQRVSSIGNYYSGLSPAQQVSPFGQRVKALMDLKSQQIAGLDRDRQIVSDKLKAFGVIGNMNFNAITSPAGLKARGVFDASRTWTPFKGGNFISAQTNNIYSLSLGGVVKLAHTYNDIKPSHFVDIHDRDGWRQLDASLMQVKGLTPAARNMYVSRFLEAPEEGRAAVLTDIESDVAKNIVDRHNLKNGLLGTPDEISNEVAQGLYKEVASKRAAAQSSIREEAYGTATVENPNLPGTQIRVDEITPDGGKTVVAPLLRSQMANNHVMMDFKLYQKAIQAEGSTWQKAFLQAGDKWQQAVGLSDYVNSIWKFSQLFRLGYGPRALSDDALGQVARFGGAAMMSRALQGGKYSFGTLRRAMTPEGKLENAMVARGNVEIHIQDLENANRVIEDDLALARHEGRTGDIGPLTDQLNTNLDDLAQARSDHADFDALVKGGQATKNQKIGRQVFDPAYGGAEGGLFKDLASGEHNYRNMMGSASDSYLNRLRRLEWTQISPAKHGEDFHLDEWKKILNQQVANDALAVNYLKGKTPQQLEHWLSTPAGRDYLRGHPQARHLPNDQLVERVTAQIDEWVNPAFPDGDALRLAASKGEVTDDMLKAVPMDARPLVNAQALSYARGSHQAMQMIDNGMSKWYHFMGQLPQEFLLRNPLFAQRYNVHLKDLMTAAGKRGESRMTEDLRLQMQSAARQRALQDVKKNTFTMDYETKMSHMLRQFGAFFGAQQESWNRWARIISDKPDILPRIAQVYGAPARAGIVTDSSGNRVAPDGTVTDPITGEKRLVDYSDRHITVQVPEYLGGKAISKFLGTGGKVAKLDPTTGEPMRDKNGKVIYEQEGARFDIPMSTAEIILNHGDGPLPVGAGPYVQIAANHLPFTALDANGDPKIADMYTQLGILPFGPTESILDTFKPNWWRKAEAGTDKTSDAYQKNLWYIMQAEHYKWTQGLRKSQPTWKEIDQRAQKQAWMRTWFAATLPISMSAKDPYDFFRKQYKQMQDLDYENADKNFYDKYGDSAFIFAQSMSKNNSGLKPTDNAVKMSKYYQDLISKVGPEWAGLVVGAEGEGAYSNGAFYYQKTHSIDPATGETGRTQLSAREALDQADLGRGWQQYKSYMNGLYAELFNRGLKSFDDDGAEDLKAEKRALVETLSDPQTMDENGNMVSNPYYNAAWSKAYNSFDLNYYDRAAASLRQIVNDPEIWSKAVNPDGSLGIRSDIAMLKTYLQYRDSVKAALIMRNDSGGSKDINAQSNADIKQQWNALVIQMIEKDLKFGDLFNHYLSRDMGFDQDTVAQEQQQGLLPQFEGSVQSFQDQNAFDVLGQQSGETGSMPTGQPTFGQGGF